VLVGESVLTSNRIRTCTPRSIPTAPTKYEYYQHIQ
jgi:hypothetical protein